MAAATPTIAEVLHYAADHCLWDGRSFITRRDMDMYSCHAIYVAVDKFIPVPGTQYRQFIERIFTGFRNMGLDTGSVLAFSSPSFTQVSRQAARYSWLKFAALIAEEQGV